MIKKVGIIGYGSFGQLIHELGQRLWPDIEFITYSRKDTDEKLDAVCASDILFLSVPISAYESTLGNVLDKVSPTTILVDVATVKAYTSKLMMQYCENNPFISCHPMFGPESLKKKQGKLAGLKIVITDHSLGAKTYDRMMSLLSKLQFDVLELSSEEHDRLLARTLFLTHYISQILTTLNIARTEIDTLSFSFLMDAVESVKQDTDLFADVYKYDPYCQEILDEMEKVQSKVIERIEE